MASDINDDKPVIMGDNVAMSVNFGTAEHITSSYEKMTVGGVIQMPLADQFWGAKFASFKDKFGVLWFFHLDTSTPAVIEEVEVVPYLRFHDNCRDVMEGCQRILGGALDIKVQLFLYISRTQLNIALPHQLSHVITT
jgi:uncharacterized glyoxalase superfamily protein PhnB